MSKLSRAELRKIKYDYVNKELKNPELARQYRDKGISTIEKELGIVVDISKPVKAEPVRELTSRQKTYYRLKLERLQEAKEVGFTSKEALQEARKGYAKSRLQSEKEYRELRNKKGLTKEELKPFWARWSSNENKLMPLSIDKRARRVNKSTTSQISNKRLDEYDKYGYVVAYTMLLEQYEDNEEAFVREFVVTPDFQDTSIVIYSQDKQIKAVR